MSNKAFTSGARIITLFVALLGALAAYFAIVDVPVVHRFVCRNVSESAWRLSWIGCDESDREVTSSSAAKFIRTFWSTDIGQSGDYTNPDLGASAAWQMVTPNFRQNDPFEQFSASTQSLAWSEVSGTVSRVPHEFNHFIVRKREYLYAPSGHSDGRIITLQEDVGLTYVNGGIELDSESPSASPNMTSAYINFPHPWLVKSANVYPAPSMRGTPRYIPGKDFHVHGTFEALCSLTIRPGSYRHVNIDDVGSWTRLPQGWIKSSALSVDLNEPTTAGPVPHIPACDPGNAR